MVVQSIVGIDGNLEVDLKEVGGGLDGATVQLRVSALIKYLVGVTFLYILIHYVLQLEQFRQPLRVTGISDANFRSSNACELFISLAFNQQDQICISGVKTQQIPTLEAKIKEYRKCLLPACSCYVRTPMFLNNSSSVSNFFNSSAFPGFTTKFGRNKLTEP